MPGLRGDDSSLSFPACLIMYALRSDAPSYCGITSFMILRVERVGSRMLRQTPKVKIAHIGA